MERQLNVLEKKRLINKLLRQKMAKKTFYPVSITPECNIPNDKLNYERTAGCAVKKHMQPLSRETTWDNLGKENNTKPP